MPAVSPDGRLMANAGRYARNAVLTAFEMIGGVDRMAKWADENPGDFYGKLFTKTITRDTEISDSRTVEDMLLELEDVTPPAPPPAPEIGRRAAPEDCPVLEEFYD